MQSTFVHIEDFVKQAGNLAETKAEIFALKATRKASVAVSEIVTRLSFVMIMIFLLLMVSFGTAYWIGTLLGSTAGGFFVIGGIYLIAGLILFLFRRKAITAPVQNYFIRKSLG